VLGAVRNRARTERLLQEDVVARRSYIVPPSLARATRTELQLLWRAIMATKEKVATFKLVEDSSRCKHEFIVGPQRRVENLLVGHCDACRHEIAVEVDKAGERTGRSWLIEYGPQVR
jgi:hypothetical protein